MPYTMNIEQYVYEDTKIMRTEVVRHPYHLGTDLAVAMTFVMQALRKTSTVSVALYKDGKLVRIYDYRDYDGSED